MNAPDLPCPVVELVPHRPPMLLLDDLTGYTEDEGSAVGRITDDNPFLLPDGRLDPLACVELIAQASAAHEGFRRRLEGGEVGGGFLVGLRDFTFEGSPRVGDLVTVVARRGTRFDALQLVTGAVFSRDREVASGEIKVFVSDLTSLPQDDWEKEPFVELPARRGTGVHPLSALTRRDVEPGASRVSYVLDGSFPAFHGHYPGRPILPAVVMAILAADALRELSGGSFRPRRLKSAKFRRPVRPGARVTVQGVVPQEASGAPWSAEVREDDQIAAVLAFEAEEPAAGRARGPECG